MHRKVTRAVRFVSTKLFFRYRRQKNTVVKSVTYITLGTGKNLDTSYISLYVLYEKKSGRTGEEEVFSDEVSCNFNFFSCAEKC